MIGSDPPSPPVFQQPTLVIEKAKKRNAFRKKISSVKSFFGDRQKQQTSKRLTRNVSMPDIYAGLNAEMLSPEYTPRKFSEGNYSKNGVVLRDKTRLNSKLNLRPRSECLQHIDENESFKSQSWMHRNSADFSPTSSVSSIRSDFQYHSSTRIDEEVEPVTHRKRTHQLTNLERLRVMESLESLISTTSYDSILTDENHNEIGRGSQPKNFEVLPGLYAKESNNNSSHIINREKHKTNKTLNGLVVPQNGHTVQSKPENQKSTIKVDKKNKKKPENIDIPKINVPPVEIHSAGHKNASPDSRDSRQHKVKPSLEHNELKFLMEFEARRVLSNSSYDAKIAAKLSKEISGNIRERLRDHTSRNYKIVVNTFIGSISPSGNEQVHMASRSVTNPDTDRFIVAALHNNDLFVAITLLLLKY